MEVKSYGRELDLVLLLTDGNFYNTAEMAEKLGITRRHLYNYFEALKKKGFKFERHGYGYAIDMSSSFFDDMRRNSSLSHEEASYICRVLQDIPTKNTTATNISNKLRRLYSLPDSDDNRTWKRITTIANKLQDAVARKATVRLNRYSSPHSNSLSDRIVEPFLMINDRQDVICYEINSDQCKTFRLARIESVDVLNVKWTYEDRHRTPFTDIFGFTSDKRYDISLRMGRLSCNLLKEEHPTAEPFIVADGNDHWRIDLICASLLGPARFVLGLYDDIKVLGSAEFKDYIKKRVKAMK